MQDFAKAYQYELEPLPRLKMSSSSAGDSLSGLTGI